ncbi:MAG: hypothetical protein SFV17_08400 [Candidatus Obscuribacter sp.]|nr:hypothetical protein [Candidatus Obscuribacter sp.]
MARKDTSLTKEEFVSEAERLVTDLAFYAGRPVRLRLMDGDHIAFTYNTEDTKNVIDVVLNPSCVKDVRNKDRARSILRGIGFHELLHHLHPAEEQYKKAIEEGFKSLLNLIDDEQNERRGTADNPQWGAHFQSVCAFIFPTARRRNNSISTGIADGGKEEEESTSGFAASEAYRLRWNEFAYHFRRHIPHTDAASSDHAAAVKAALALIPGNFKDLSKDELLNLTREVHLTLARGLELPEPPGKQDQPDKSKPSPGSPAAPDDDDDKGGGLFSGAGKEPFWKSLFTSKWSYITLGILLVLWAAIFSRGGSQFWFNAAIALAVIGSTVVGAVFLSAWLRRFMNKRRHPELVLSEKKGPGPLRRAWNQVKSKTASTFRRTFGFLPKVFSSIGRAVKVGPIGKFGLRLKLGWNITWRGIKLGYFKFKWAMNWLWHRKLLRILLISIPIACLLMMLWAVMTRAGEVNWWLAVLLLLLLLLLLFLGWYYRAKLKDFLVGDLVMDSDFEHAANITPPMDFETLDFNLIDDILPVESDDAFLMEHLPTVQPLAHALRPVLAKVGKMPRDKEDEPVGHDVIDELEALYLGETNVFVDEEEVNSASLHIEVAIDCSSSMTSENATLKRGEKFKLAKLFALVVEEATRNQRGISTRFWGFTDGVIYDCGTAGQYKSTGLRAMGGNNDSAMLYHMGKSAQASGKAVKMLFMLSDGQPSNCSWGSLRNLVVRLEADGMVPWHFALDQIKDSAFEKYFTDLCGQPLPEAIMTMCGILAAIAENK